ncbi:MAG: TIGR01440 family protein, partial [Acidaminococcaceae bacterium]|nr:TIGR01440 family protein [Acidaminococcaceae bacterium]
AHGLYLAVQCCEHLNRALVVEEVAMDAFGLTQVTVHPVPEAGGSAASRAYELFDHPVVVETVTADLGMDIGQTLIGMHLKRVAVPVRLQVKTVGEAVLTAARTRPPLIGGERAKYF